MTPNQRILLAIAAFVAFVILSFGWFLNQRLNTQTQIDHPLLLAVNIPGVWGLAPTCACVWGLAPTLTPIKTGAPA